MYVDLDLLISIFVDQVHESLGELVEAVLKPLEWIGAVSRSRRKSEHIEQSRVVTESIGEATSLGHRWLEVIVSNDGLLSKY